MDNSRRARMMYKQRNEQVEVEKAIGDLESYMDRTEKSWRRCSSI